MELEEMIIKELKEFSFYVNSFVEAPSAFSLAFYHPKTDKRITYSEKCTLIERDAKKRADKIAKKINRLKGI